MIFGTNPPLVGNHVVVVLMSDFDFDRRGFEVPSAYGSEVAPHQGMPGSGTKIGSFPTEHGKLFG